MLHSMTIILCIAISILTAWAVFMPLLSGEQLNNLFAERSDLMLLQDQKNRSVNMLRDLELDFSTGKLSKEEYKSIK